MVKHGNEFDKCLNKLNNLYKENPKKTSKETQKLIEKLGAINRLKKGKFLQKTDKEILLMAGLGLLIALLGFINISEESIPYYGGIIFFFAGYLSGLFVPIFGIIFLFTHGITGISLMIGCTLSPVLNNPLMEDNPSNIYIYFGVIIFFVILATILTIFHNLNSDFRKLNNAKNIPLIIYTVAIFLASLLPKILIFIYGL